MKRLLFILALLLALIGCGPDHFTPPIAGPNQTNSAGFPDGPVFHLPGSDEPDASDGGPSTNPVDADVVLRANPGTFAQKKPVTVRVALAPHFNGHSLLVGALTLDAGVPALEFTLQSKADGGLEIGVYIPDNTTPGVYTIVAEQGGSGFSTTVQVLPAVN